jgi:hypothetical protein
MPGQHEDQYLIDDLLVGERAGVLLCSPSLSCRLAGVGTHIGMGCRATERRSISSLM